MTFGLATIDLAVIVVYLIGITYIGLCSSRGVKSSGDFFMGGRRFGKPSLMAKTFGVGTRVDYAVSGCML